MISEAGEFAADKGIEHGGYIGSAVAIGHFELEIP